MANLITIIILRYCTT